MNVIKTNSKGFPTEVELDPNESWVHDRYNLRLNGGEGVIQAAENAMLDFWYAFPGCEDTTPENFPCHWEFFRYLVDYTDHKRPEAELAASSFYDASDPTRGDEWPWFLDEDPVEGNFLILDALRYHTEHKLPHPEPRKVQPVQDPRTIPFN